MRTSRIPLLLALALLAACARDLPFTLLFKDARGLKAGDPLVYRGMTIGEVESVQLDGVQVRVAVKVKSDHRNTVYREAQYVIENRNGLLDTSGLKQVTMKDSGTARSAVQKADVLQGTDALADIVRDKLRELPGKVLERVLP